MESSAPRKSGSWRSALPDWGEATELPDVHRAVSIVGVGEADATRASGRSPQQIAAQAVERALEDAALSPSAIDGLLYSGGIPDQFDAAAFRAHFGTRQDIWESGRGGGMTGAATAPVQAAQAIREGKASRVLNVFSVAWASQRGEMTGGPGAFHAADRLKANLEVPFGFFPQPVYFATIARRHAIEYGTQETDLGAIAVSARRHAQLHPGAFMRDRPLSLAEYLERPMLVDPLRVEDCCLISDGGAAYIMSPADSAEEAPKAPIDVLGVGEGVSGTGLFWSQQRAFTSTPQVFSAPAAFAMARLDPEDVDVLALYDPFTIVTLMQIEDMGFCGKGEGGAFVADGGLDFDRGRLPTNTHGGLLSHAYVLGIAHVVEIVRQLRGEAAAQVEAPRVGVYGGYTGHQGSTLVLGSRA